MELTYDSQTNSLHLALSIPDEPAEPASIETIDGILDIGEGGRFIGVEFEANEAVFHLWLIDPIAGAYAYLDADDRAYIQLSPDDDGDVRSTRLLLTAEFNASGEMIGIVIPRRGHGYEITYPAGNQ